ncbi:hypothetical protein Ornrh_2116 [Ornithobacterium rhinotracheale DSM 15997]|uniref:Uncharacterized protein n=1 Tax=Ornithobacterium rhinotracheale (strain ATCC 51463 / DSM 15997 / CCUG 23171 / CIP 104009 / LMG 9086) TaxID=867902 RepID=I4A2R4_ORNRL|nr:hypothetical protein Ornrh_2116 [Ornithobacterium rhinotracheale DSM 15997]
MSKVVPNECVTKLNLKNHQTKIMSILLIEILRKYVY